MLYNNGASISQSWKTHRAMLRKTQVERCIAFLSPSSLAFFPLSLFFEFPYVSSGGLCDCLSATSDNDEEDYSCLLETSSLTKHLLS